MRGHLSDEEMAALVADSAGERARLHLATCARCQDEWVRLGAGVSDLRAHLHADAERPEGFFRAQRAKIEAALLERPPLLPAWHTVWAPAFAAIVVLLVSVFMFGRSPEPPPAHDDELLAAVQRSITEEVPAALRPAAVLIAEVERGVAHPDRGSVSRGDQP